MLQIPPSFRFHNSDPADPLVLLAPRISTDREETKSPIYHEVSACMPGAKFLLRYRLKQIFHLLFIFNILFNAVLYKAYIAVFRNQVHLAILRKRILK